MPIEWPGANPAGDAIVAEFVFGCRVECGNGYPACVCKRTVHHDPLVDYLPSVIMSYTSTGDGMMFVVEKMDDHGYCVVAKRPRNGSGPPKALFQKRESFSAKYPVDGWCSDPLVQDLPEAVAVAAVRALGYEVVL